MILFSEAKISPKGTVNTKDLKKILRDTLIFFGAPILMYLSQLMGTLNVNKVLLLPDFIPTILTIGAMEGWLIGIAINFFLKFQDGTK